MSTEKKIVLDCPLDFHDELCNARSSAYGIELAAAAYVGRVEGDPAGRGLLQLIADHIERLDHLTEANESSLKQAKTT